MIPGLDTALRGAVDWISGNLLVDTVRIVRPSMAQPVLNEDTGQLEYPEAAVVYEGPGAVQGGTAQSELATVPDVGQSWQQDTRSRFRLFTPLQAPLAAKDDIVTVTAVHNPANPALLGRSWICQDPSRAATVEVVRITPLDQNTATRGAP